MINRSWCQSVETTIFCIVQLSIFLHLVPCLFGLNLLFPSILGWRAHVQVALQPISSRVFSHFWIWISSASNYRVACHTQGPFPPSGICTLYTREDVHLYLAFHIPHISTVHQRTPCYFSGSLLNVESRLLCSEEKKNEGHVKSWCHS